MKITKISGNYIPNQYRINELKEILDNTILKDNYFFSKNYFSNRKPLDFPEFKNNKYYFSDLAQIIIEKFKLDFFKIEINFEENNIKFKQRIELMDYNLELKHGLALDSGLFCPHCFSSIDLKQFLENITCCSCGGKASECIDSEIFTFEDYLGEPRTEIYYICKNAPEKYSSYVSITLYEARKNNFEKTIKCHACKKEYKVKDIEYGFKDSLETIKTYPKPNYDD